MDIQKARNFADHWIEAWNERDIEKILSFYHRDFIFTSQMVRNICGNDGTLTGIDAIRALWSKALERIPDLKLELMYVTAGINMVSICYLTIGDRVAIETFCFDADGKIIREMACSDI